MTDEDLPALFQSADAAAIKAQRHYLGATRIALASTVIAAIFGAVSVTAHGTNWAALVATAAFVATIGTTVFLLTEKPERRWYEGRAGAESAKTLAWKYAVGGADFELELPEHEADAEILARLRDIARGLRHVRLTGGAGGDQITQPMRELRSSDFDTRKATYRRYRVADQRTWYSSQATQNEHMTLAWRLASLAFQLLGVVGGVLRTAGVIETDLLGIAAAATAAALAWLQAKDYATLAEAYSVTQQELSLVDAELEGVGEAEWPAAVDSAEQAVSREHTLWRARRATLDGAA